MNELRDDIEKYLKGELSPNEMHALEKKALSDPFLADALEGGMMIDKNEFFSDVDELNQKIRARKNVFFTPLRIAAGIILLIGISLFFLLSPKEEKKVELVQKKDTPKEIKKQDSVAGVKPEQTEEPEEKKQKSNTPIKREPIQQPEPEVQSIQPTITTIPKVDSISVPSPVIQIPRHIIEGTVVTAEEGLPLPGATVVVKGTTHGTTTDINGKYSIEVNDDQSLVFSYIGMHSNEVNTKDKSTLDVKLAEDVSQLSEVVITRAPLPKKENEEPVVKLAQPVGGMAAYDKYLEKNRKYSELALANDVKGKVIIGFDIGTNGELGNFEVIRSLGFGCDEEVMRLVKEGPGWRPTTEDDVPVESTVRVKLKFDAAKYKARKK